MAVGRRYSISSLPRYYMKMVARYFSITATAVAVETVTSVPGASDTAQVSAFTVASNWVNGFHTYSELRYKVLPILAKYGVNRSNAYIFMAELQHAYKQLVQKDVTTVDEIVDRFITAIWGNQASQRQILDIPIDVMANIVQDLLALIGIKATVTIPS